MKIQYISLCLQGDISNQPRSMLLLDCGSSKLHELRSLLPACLFMALTAKGTSDTRETIFESLLFSNPCTIIESPNKDNISYIVN